MKSVDIDALGLSVVILTRNVEDRLAHCVSPWLSVARVFLVDDGSTDGTVAKGRALGCTVLEREAPQGNFDLNRKWGLQRAEQDGAKWLAYFDSDEVPTEELVAEVVGWIRRGADTLGHSGTPGLSAPQGARIPNYFYFLGHRLRHGIFNPRSAELRLFRAGAWEYPCEAGFHRSVSLVRGRPDVLSAGYRHFNVNSLSEWFEKTNQYTSGDAEASRASTWGAVWRLFHFFVKHFFWKQGFRDGFPGFVSCLYFGLYHFTLSVKSWELQQRAHWVEGQDFLAPFKRR